VTSDRDSQVLIVGAGPAGAALALLLAQRGVQVTLVERQVDFAREFRGEIVMPSGWRVLEALGLGRGLEEIPQRHPGEIEIFHNQRRLFGISLDQQPSGGMPVSLSQPRLLETLVEVAQTHSGFRFLRGASVKEVLRAGDRIDGVRVQTAEGSQVLRAGLVIGADGRASTVRRGGGFTAQVRDAPMDIVWAKLPWPSSWKEGKVQAVVGHGHLLIAFPAPDGELQVAWVILKGAFGALRARGISEWVEEMANHVGAELGSHLRTNKDTLSRPFLLDVVTDRVEGWSRPGALVIGDAAHTMSPVGGQGINVALRDAVVTANHLVPVLQAGATGEILDAAAAMVEPERGPEIDAIQSLAALPPRVVLRRGWTGELVRFALLPLLGRVLAPLTAKPLRQLFDGVTHVELKV